MKIKYKMYSVLLLCVSITLGSCGGGGGGNGDDSSPQTGNITVSLTDIAVHRKINGDRLAVDTSAISNNFSYSN